MLLCLHHNDADGLCAGAIVRYRFGPNTILQEIDYGLSLPWAKIEQAETIIITDFSLPKADMQKILAMKGQNFIWIDHHISAINDMADLPPLNGLRDISKAACVLTWEYCFPDQPVPQAVALIGERDIWQFKHPDTKTFCEGLYYAETQADNDELWQSLFENKPETMQTFIQQGQLLLSARLKDIARQVKSDGFERDFCGYKTLLINLPSSGDVGHYICSLGYDVAYVYRDALIDDNLYTKVTLYSETTDVSVLAKRFGGGGHKGAAGFRFQRDSNWPLPTEKK